MTDTPISGSRFLSFAFRLFRFVMVICVAAGLAYFLFTLRKEPEKKEIVKTPPSVTVIRAVPVSRVMTVEAYGTVKPRKLVQIAVEVPGRIDYLHPNFIEGGRIAKGDILIRIDQRSYKLDRQAGLVRIQQAVADIDSLKQDIKNLDNDLQLSKANVTIAKKELERIRTLTRNKFASKTSLDKTEQQYLQAKIQLQTVENRLASTGTMMELKKAALDMARVDFQKADLALKKTTIKAEFDGYILDKKAEKSEYVNPGQVIGSIYKKDELDVDVRIPLEKMKWIEAFFENGKTPRAEIVVANFDGLKQLAWQARVARIKANVDEKTRTLPMTLEILNPGVTVKNIFDLKPGTFVRCMIQGERIDNIIVLPRHLIKPDNIVFTVSEGRLEMKKVGVLRKFEDSVYINAGLADGDRVISSPLPGALNGMALTVTESGGRQ